MDVKVNAALDMSGVEAILNARGLNAGGKVQQFMATQLVKISDPYAPLRTGILKNSAVRNLAPPYNEIVYDGPQAARLYYNPSYNFNGAPTRGAYWITRAWANHKDAFLANLQAYVKQV